MGDAKRRWSGTRLGLLVLGALSAAALAVTSVASYRAAMGAAEIVGGGEAEALQFALRERMREAPLDERALAAFVQEHEAHGLLHAAVFRGDELLAAAGEPLADHGRPRPGQATRVGAGLRLASPAPPPRHGPPVGLPRGAHPPPPFGALLLVVDMTPVVALELTSSAERNLLVGLVTALLLLIASGLAGWLGARAETAESKAASQRHLATLGEMSATMAHELRNPLAALKGHTQLLLELADEATSGGRVRADEVRHRAARVVTEAVRLEQLTTTLLDLSRSGDVLRKQTSPAEVLRAAVHGTDAERVDVREEGAPPTFSLDPIRMRQVLTNLLLNALQAAPDERVEATVSAHDQDLLYAVRDRGPGVPLEARERIFEAFHTDKLRGTGLGLAVAKRITDLHGGRIEIDDHPEGGAVFRVIIPGGG
jgi:two-component system sensor histidine kinase HydH